jgi:hemolysin activation/secretion protein
MSFAIILWFAAAAPGVGSGIGTGTGVNTTTPLIIDRGRIDRTPQPDLPDERTNPKRGGVVVNATSPSTAIRGIGFRGEKVPARVAEAAKPFLGRPADKPTLTALAAALSAAYAKSDIALYTIAIGAQDFAGGQVRVDVIEGYVAATAIVDPKKRAHPRARHIAESLIGVRPLSRTRFERQISLMRDIPGFEYDLAALSGGSDGAISLAITPRQKRTKFDFGYSNRGTQLLGSGQFEGSAKLFGALARGDQFSLSGASSSNFRNFLYVGAGYQLPVGYDGIIVSANTGYLKTRPRSVPIEGSAKTAGVTVSYPLIRGYKRDVLLSAGIDGINSDNAAFGSLIASERTRAARISASGSQRSQKRSVEVSATVSRGLAILGSRVDVPFAERGFTKGNLAAAVGQQIGKVVFVRVRGSGQYTRDRLPAAERFAVGGADFGRAFDAGILSADRGVAGSVEFAVMPKIAKKFENSELYVFTDGARVQILDRGPFAGASYGLASAGVGTRLRYSTKAEVGLEGAKTISRPYPGLTDNWRLSVQWRLAL